MPIWTPLLLGLAAASATPQGAGPHAHHEAHRGILGPHAATREASGTSWQPEAAPMEGVHVRRGAWTLMLHGFAFGLYGGQTGGRSDSGFPVAKLDLGAVREVASAPRFTVGVGFTLGAHRLSEILEEAYGRRPWSYTIFARLRPR